MSTELQIQKEVFALIDRMADGRCICARLSTFTGNATTECFCRFLFFFSWCNIRSLVDVGVCMCLPEERIQCLGIYTFAFLRLGLAFLRTPFLAGAFLPLFPFTSLSIQFGWNQNNQQQHRPRQPAVIPIHS